MDAAGATTGRLEWVDGAKGIGIVLVVIGHVWTSGTVRDAIYAFHMPLFFLLAGYVASARPMRSFVVRQAQAMMVPYFAFLTALIIADMLIEHYRGHMPIFRTWAGLAKAYGLGGTELRGPFTIFWFVPCLFLARLFQNWLMVRWPDVRDWRWCVTMAATVAMGIGLGAESDFSPWGMLTVPVATVIVWIGTVWRDLARSDAGRSGRWIMTGAMVVAAVALTMAPIQPLNMKVGDYGQPLVSLPLALALSVLLCLIAKMVNGLRLFPYLGRRSLTIMYCHVAVIHYGAPYYSKYWLLFFAVLIPLIIHECLARTYWGRRLFLGMADAKPAKTSQNVPKENLFRSWLRR